MSRQIAIKPVLTFTGQTYGFAVINNTYQAVMQSGRAWIPVATIPAFIVADWLMQKGLLAPLGMLANGTHLPGGATRSRRNAQAQVSTGNRV